MPSFPLVDSHVHLWEPTRLRYPWLSEIPRLNRTHALADYTRDCGAVAVGQLVFVQCDCDPTQSVAEARWVSELAATDPRLAGIVAQASLEKGESVEPDLQQLAGVPRVKGVRRLIQSEPDDAFCARPEFIRGVKRLAPFGFTFDLCLFHRQLASAIQLVRSCPEITFILDHAGKPAIKERRLDPWRAELRELSRCENVHCKVSGLATEADWNGWSTADLKPYVDHVIDCFGFDRVMFGGDWPVSTLATDFPRWVATVDELLQGCSEHELRRFYQGNAERVYRL